jgi:hypothetical protein
VSGEQIARLIGQICEFLSKVFGAGYNAGADDLKKEKIGRIKSEYEKKKLENKYRIIELYRDRDPRVVIRELISSQPKPSKSLIYRFFAKLFRKSDG